MDTRWRIELLGRLRARRGDHEVAHFPRQKAGTLLAYLAFTHSVGGGAQRGARPRGPRHPHPREALTELLWPEIAPELGRQYFRNALHALREQLAPGDDPQAPLLLTDRTSVGLRPETFRTDVGEFAAALAAARAAPADEQAAHLAAAAAAYGGALLPDSFESWVLVERETLQGQYLEALHQWVAALEAAGDLAGALERARQAVSADPLREESHYDLMRLYAATGQPSACVRQYQELERVLREELDETPSAEARALAEELRVSARTLVVARRVPAQDPLPASRVIAPSPPGPRLPTQLTRFFGREEEIAHLAALIGSTVTRLVTVTGPGGSGKTRLAIAAAGRLKEGFGTGDRSAATPGATQEVPGGRLAFAALADVTDASLLVEAIADSLELERSAGAERVLAQIIQRLRERPWLLVLDNFEHLVETGAPLVARLLEQIPTLTCLVTSRRSLCISGEQEFALLPLPTPRRSDSLEQLRDCPSVQLFVDRARAVKADFQLTEANAAAVGELCDRLEGLPLALELAAARVGILAPGQMLAHVGGRFEFLVSRQRDVPARHRTLRAAIDSSFQLLSPELQRFFARLSVFRGGWTLEAAGAVCGGVGIGCWVLGVRGPDADPTPNTQHPIPTLDCLQQLRDCSLILVSERGGEVRYRLLETLREYAAEQLTSSGERTAVRNRHRDWYLQFASQAEAASRGPEQMAWLTRLEAEIDNLRAALAWCQEAADADPAQGAPGDAAAAALRLATASYWLWMRRGYVGEGQQWLEGALARGSRCPPRLRARALTGMAELASAAEQHHQSRTLRALARQEQEKAVLLARAEGDARDTAQAVLLLAEAAASMHEEDAAWSHAAEARQRLEALGDRSGLARAVNVMARVAGMRDNPEALRGLLEEVEGLCRETGDYDILIHVLGTRGHLARDAGELVRARTFYQESLLLRRDIGHQIALAQSLEDFAVLAGRERQAQRAIRLLGAAGAFCETLGARPPVSIAEDYERTVAEGRAALGEAAFAAAWAEGRAMLLEQAVAYALDAS